MGRDAALFDYGCRLIGRIQVTREDHKMKRSHANCHYRTDLKSVDHEQFFDPLNYPRTSSKALRAAFRGQKEILSNLDADPLIKADRERASEGFDEQAG